jgi:protein SCO1/2
MVQAIQAGRRRVALTSAIVFLGAVALAAALYLALASQRALPGSLVGGPFTLVGADGRTVTDQDFKGEPFLVFFGYTHCPDVCPLTLTQISDVLRKLGPDKKVAALFITVDPERDTPAVMKDYLSSFDTRIEGLSGDATAIAAAEKAYRVYAKKVPGEGTDYSMDHTSIVYLMDKQGRFVTAVNLDQTPDAVAHDLSDYL